MKDLFRAWWPLTLSWFCLTFEAILVVVFIGRMPDSKNQIASFAGVVYPFVCLFEAPIYPVLSAANALCEDRLAYRSARRYTRALSIICSATQAFVLIPPLFNFLLGDLLHVPEPVRGECYLPMLILVPTSILVANRRFSQGVLIRLGQARSVGRGTILRMASMISFLGIAFFFLPFAGANVGALACLLGVTVEALYATRCVRVALPELPERGADSAASLSLMQFVRFYAPLAMTAILILVVQPLVTAGINRGPDPLTSLLVWPLVWQLCVSLGAVGATIPDLCVSFLAKGVDLRTLDRFTWYLIGGLAASMMIALVPASTRIWFGSVLGLPPELVQTANVTLVCACAAPLFRCRANLFVGRLLAARRTVAITEGIAVSLSVLVIALFVLVPFAWRTSLPGTYVAGVAMTVSTIAQMLWLRYRARQLPG